MQLTSSRVGTRVAVSLSYDYSHCTLGTWSASRSLKNSIDCFLNHCSFLVSIEDEVKLSTQIRRLSLLSWCFCVVEYCHAEGGHYRLSIIALSGYYLFRPMKEGLRGKHYACVEEEKTAVMKRVKENIFF